MTATARALGIGKGNPASKLHRSRARPGRRPRRVRGGPPQRGHVSTDDQRIDQHVVRSGVAVCYFASFSAAIARVRARPSQDRHRDDRAGLFGRHDLQGNHPPRGAAVYCWSGTARLRVSVGAAARVGAKCDYRYRLDPGTDCLNPTLRRIGLTQRIVDCRMKSTQSRRNPSTTREGADGSRNSAKRPSAPPIPRMRDRRPSRGVPVTARCGKPTCSSEHRAAARARHVGPWTRPADCDR